MLESETLAKGAFIEALWRENAEAAARLGAQARLETERTVGKSAGKRKLSLPHCTFLSVT